ncbi:hypothetical protein [Embleya sp. NPDC005971]|uniref:hypothetical protein n=1 Tax=Embleya sp. NPDC005971 TaxID=3156724 RepID=UPI0033F349FD
MTTEEIASPAPVPVYQDWDDVPEYLLTQTQHAELDLPRKPCQTLAGRVWAKDWARRHAELFDLYDVRASTPTRSTASRSSDAYVCAECGARTERPVKVRDGVGRCPACARVARIAAEQAGTREARARQLVWARGAVADPASVWVYLEYPERTRGPNGRRRPPAGVAITAADAAGRRLLRERVRLAGPRSQDPAAADWPVPLDRALPKLVRTLQGRKLITWCPEHAQALAGWIADGGGEVGWLGSGMRERVVAWRSLVDVRGRAVSTCLDPGRADRMVSLAVRMAEDREVPADARAWLASARGAMLVDIRGDEAAALRLHAMLRMLGVVAVDTDPSPVPDPAVPGAVSLPVWCRPDGMPDPEGPA